MLSLAIELWTYEWISKNSSDFFLVTFYIFLGKRVKYVVTLVLGSSSFDCVFLALDATRIFFVDTVDVGSCIPKLPINKKERHTQKKIEPERMKKSAVKRSLPYSFLRGNCIENCIKCKIFANLAFG